jgi:hypothetical protein
LCPGAGGTDVALKNVRARGKARLCSSSGKTLNIALQKANISAEAAPRAFDEKVESLIVDSHDGANRIQDPHWNKGASHEWGSLIPTICVNVWLRQSKPTAATTKMTRLYGRAPQGKRLVDNTRPLENNDFHMRAAL